jgi:hypothetical protein
MVQFNLLPDVKLQYIKARRLKRSINVVAFFTAAGSLAILVLLFSFVNVEQKLHMRHLNSDIKKYTTQLKNTQNLNKILTIQNQLNTLPGLLSARPQSSRIFDYVEKVTPDKASINKLHADFVENNLVISGSADTLETVNKYVDTLKFTTYAEGDRVGIKTFPSVVLSNFGRDTKNATYEITAAFDPAIFTDDGVTLVVPKTITTRSEIEQPTQLFDGVPTPTPATGGTR